VQAVIGLVGGVWQLVVTIVLAAAGLALLWVLWQSGAIPGLFGLIGDLLGIARAAVSGFFRFLGELIRASGSGPPPTTVP
jgi:hypothetical protein